MAPKAKTAKGSAAAVAEVPTTKLLNALKAELTEKDLADAKAALAKVDESSTEKRRMEANMFYYVKKSGEVPAGSSLRGDRRREYLVLWMAKTMKDKNAVVSIDTVHEVSSKTESNDGAEWMGLEQMRRIHGEERVKAWMESGKLIKAPCPVTGSLEDNLADFKVPKKTESKIGSEEFKHGSKSSKEGGSEAEWLVHQATMADMAGNLVDQLMGLAGEGEGTEVKTEAEAADKESLENLAVFKNTKVLPAGLARECRRGEGSPREGCRYRVRRSLDRGLQILHIESNIMLESPREITGCHRQHNDRAYRDPAARQEGLGIDN